MYKLLNQHRHILQTSRQSGANRTVPATWLRRPCGLEGAARRLGQSFCQYGEKRARQAGGYIWPRCPFNRYLSGMTGLLRLKSQCAAGAKRISVVLSNSYRRRAAHCTRRKQTAGATAHSSTILSRTDASAAWPLSASHSSAYY